MGGLYSDLVLPTTKHERDCDSQGFSIIQKIYDQTRFNIKFIAFQEIS